MAGQRCVRAGLVLGSIVLLATGCARDEAASERSGAVPVVAPTSAVRRTPPASRVEGEILVRFRASATPAARAGLHLALRSLEARDLPGPGGLQLVRLPQGASVTDALRTAAARPDVLYAEPNYVISAHALPDDPGFSDQWSLSNTGQFGAPGHDIDAPRAWDLTTGSRDVVVAVIDGGIEYRHPDLVPNLYASPTDCDGDGLDDDANGHVDDCHGISVVAGDPDLMDRTGHGTHVTGTIAAAGDNGVGITGVAWRASIVGCKFLDADGLGSVAGAVACLDYVAALKDAGVNVVATNSSWGGRFASRALSEAIDAQRRRGILLVTSAGNDGLDVDLGPVAPCSDPSPNVLCVGASGAGDLVAPWSNLGQRSVHLVAPGVGILSTVPEGYGGYQVMDGTSMAAPHVTGAVALLHAYRPGSDWREVRNRILASATPAPSAYTVSGGRLDAHQALTCSTAPLTRRLAPTVDALATSGKEPITLSALHIDCGAPAGEVTVTVAPGGASVVLRDDGVAPDLVAGDGQYAAAWTPPGRGRLDLAFPGGDHVAVDVDPDLKAGFPAQVWRDGAFAWATPNPVTVGDLDGDGALEIVTGGLPSGEVYAFEAGGGSVAGWPLPPPPNSTSNRDVGAARTALARSWLAPPRWDVAVAYDHREGSSSWAAYAFASGAAEFLWYGGFVEPQPASRTPVAADLDGDGLDEVGFNGFLRSAATARWAPLETGPGGVAAADLFGDGRRLLVYQHAPQGGLMAVDLVAGEIVTGFPVPTVGVDPVIGDVDGDGEAEIVVVAGTGQTTSEARLYAPNGLLMATLPLVGGWPAPPALADLDGDGTLEIMVLASQPGALNVVRADGVPVSGWPVVWDEATEAGASAPVVGDVDGDGQPDVAVTTHVVGGGPAGHARVLDRHGLAIPGFPKALPIGAGAVPAIADLDGDGRNELVVVGSADFGQPRLVDEVWVYDLGGTGPAPWGQYRRDAGHAGEVAVAAPRPRSYLPLTVATVGDGVVRADAAGIHCGAHCARLLEAGTLVELSAQPASGRVFKGWGGACAGTDPACRVTMAAATSVSATFAPTPHRLTVSRAGAGGGTITSLPAGIDCGTTCEASYDGFTRVVLVATPAPGSTLAGWSGDCAAASPACDVVLDADKAVTARFEASAPVAVAVTGAGRVTSAPAGIDCTGSCQATFVLGASVVLTATPASGMVFVGWGGDCSGEAATCTLTADGPRSVTALFEVYRPLLVLFRAGTGAGRVTSVPAGLDCDGPCSAPFDKGAQVTLSATPGPFATFGGWFGCDGSGPTCTVTMNIPRGVTARFDAIQFPITVTRAGAGFGTITSSPAGLSCSTDCTARFDGGTTLTLTAAPAAGATFVGWEGACSGTNPTCTLPVDAARSVTGRFDQVRYALDVTRTGDGDGLVTASSGGLSCGDACSATYAALTSVTLTASAAAGSTFLGWGGACSGPVTTCTVHMDAARSVTARFDRRRYTLAVSLAGAGGGAVDSSPAGIACGQTCSAAFDPGTPVTLTATAGPGSRFAGWTGACSGAATACQVTMSAAKAVTATFALAPVQHTVTVLRAGSGQGEVTSTPAGLACGATCAASFEEGTTVTLRAAAAAGSTFAGWSGGACSGTSPTCTLPVTSDRTVTVTFDLTTAPPAAAPGSGGCASAPGGPPGLSLLLWPLLAALVRPRRSRRTAHLAPRPPSTSRLEIAMSLSRPLRRGALALAALLLAACGEPTATQPSDVAPPIAPAPTAVVSAPSDLWRPAAGTTPATGNYVYLESDLGDPMGGGVDRLYTDADAVLSLGLAGRLITVQVRGAPGWYGQLQVMDSLSAPVVGYYPGAKGWPLVGPGAGLDWARMPPTGACSGSSHWFAIDAIQIVGGTLTALDARFEQTCATQGHSLRGAIHWSAAEAVPPPGPVQPVPDGLWQPAPGATPEAGDFVYFESAPGEPLGRGESTLILPGESTVTFAVDGPTLSLTVIDIPSLYYMAYRHSIHLTAMAGQATVQPGYYPELSNRYNANPARGILELTYRTTCSGIDPVEGWVAIDAVDATSIELRFEQRCAWFYPPLRGKIRWTMRPPVAPGPAQPPVVPPPADLWRPAQGVTPTSGTFVYVEGEPGDPVTGGATFLWLEPPADLFAGSHRNILLLSATADGVGSFKAQIEGPADLGTMTAGYYAGLTRLGFQDQAVGGMDVEVAPWGGNPSPCGRLDGWVAVDAIAVVDGKLKVIDLRFEQRCAGAAGAMRGRFRWEDPVHVPVPGPGEAPPDLWHPFPAALPPSGSHVYLENDDGDWIGGGNFSARPAQVRLLRGEEAQLTARGDGAGGIHFEAVAEETWKGSFKPMELQSQLVPGYYEVIGWWTLPDTRAAAMTWYPTHRACNTTDGWFMVDAVTWSGGELQSLDLRFEQHCDWSGPALRGVVHWNASDPGYQPPAPPAELWDAPAGATPATGSYVYLEQDPPALPEWARQLFTRSDALLFASIGSQGLVISASGERSTYGHFSVPSIGFHPVAPANTGGARLDWECSDQVTGWYQVDRFENDASGVLAVDLRFEQHCAGSSRALRGKVHLVSGDATAPPGPTPPPAGLWDAPAGAVPAGGTYVYLQSSLGDPAGQAGTWLYTRTNSDLVVTPGTGGVQVEIGAARRWSGQIAAPYGKPLAVGYYANASKQNPVYPRLVWSGALGCAAVTGWISIDAVTFGAGGVVSTLDARFEQHCNGIVPALRGKVHWEAADTSAPPGPVVPPPPGLWSAPPGATPASGNYVYLESDPGEFVTQGVSHLYTQADAALDASLGARSLAVRVDGLRWTGNFTPMSSLAQVIPGYYGGLDGNPAFGALDWSGEGRGCATEHGWFSVDGLTLEGSTVVAVDLRFEQRCEPLGPALRGQVHWVRGDPTTPPGPVFPPPAGLWDAPAGAVPSTGSYVYLESEAGDPIALGRTLLLTEDQRRIHVATKGRLIHVALADPFGHVDWHGDFQVLGSQLDFDPGYYAGAERFPSVALAPSLVWEGDRFPNTSNGWFTIDAITWGPNGIASLDLRFAQYAQGILDPIPPPGTGPALHGKIHWVAP